MLPFTDLHLATERQRSSGSSVHRYADIRAQDAGGQKPHSGRRRVQIHIAAEVPGPTEDIVSGFAGLEVGTGWSAIMVVLIMFILVLFCLWF